MKNIFTFVKKLMSKYIHYIYALLFGGLLIATVISFHNNNALEARIKTLNKISPTANSEKTFKEDYYITQQSNDTTLILTCFGLGFALFSFFTYQSVVGSVADEVSRMKKNYKAHKNDYNIQHNKIVKVEKDLYLQIAKLASDRSDYYYSKGDMPNYIISSLNTCEQYAKVLNRANDESELFRTTIYMSIYTTLKLTEIRSTNYDFPILCTDSSLEKFDQRVKAISEVLNNDNKNSLYKIVSRISVKELNLKDLLNSVKSEETD